MIIQGEYIDSIQMFGVNMIFISLIEVKNVNFMSGEAKNEIYIFLHHKMK